VITIEPLFDSEAGRETMRTIFVYLNFLFSALLLYGLYLGVRSRFGSPKHRAEEARPEANAEKRMSSPFWTYAAALLVVGYFTALTYKLSGGPILETVYSMCTRIEDQRFSMQLTERVDVSLADWNDEPVNPKLAKARTDCFRNETARLYLESYRSVCESGTASSVSELNSLVESQVEDIIEGQAPVTDSCVKRIDVSDSEV
jgi:hypothetical protein